MVRSTLVVSLLYGLAWLLSSRIDPALPIQRIARAGIACRIVGLFARRWIIDHVYSGSADSKLYDSQARILIQAKHEGLDPLFLGYRPQGKETGHLVQIVTKVYGITGANEIAGFFIFALFSWIGAVCFYKAASIAIPNLDRRKYALLVFTVPSLVYWPSSIGKDAWMLMMLGITTLGAAILNKHLANPAGVGCIAVGLSGAAYLRGHLVAIAAVALAVAQMWPRRGRGTVRTVITLVLAIGCLTYASSAVTSKFGGDDAAERDDSVSSILSFANNQTAQGGSNFKPVAVTNPTTLPLGIVTVLFRPLPLIDARSGRQFIGALEAMILLVLTYRSRRSLFASFRQFGRSVHVRFATTYTLAFVIPFSYIANFGILARQRTQVLPLFFILLALLPDLAPDGVDVPSEKSDLRATSGTTTADPRTPVLRRYRYPTRL